MPEPLSIVTGVLTLIGLTGSVASELWKLHDGATVVNGTISGLQNDVKAFQIVLEAMRTAFERITAEGSTGHIGSLWESVAQSVADGKDGLEQLRDLIAGINKDTKFLDEYRKHARLNRTEEKINRSRIHIQSCRDTLHLSLQTIILVNQQTFQNVAEQQVVPSLAELQESVHRIAHRLSKMMKSSRPSDLQPGGDTHQMTMKNLLGCVRSAASVISDASTTVTVEHEADTKSQRSQALSQPLPHQSIALRRWFESRAIYEYSDDQHMDVNPPASVADVQPLDDGEEDADSDTDLQSEMTRLLLDRGKQKLVAGNPRGAERLFLNSLEQLGSVRIGNKDGQALELEATEALYGMYHDQERWSLAEKMLSRSIAIRQRTSTDSSSDFLADALSLARLLKEQKKNPQAHLHARRALKGYRKLQDFDGTRSCLQLLIDLCHADGSDNDLDAYEIMLNALTEGTFSPSEPSEPAALGETRPQDTADIPAPEGQPLVSRTHSFEYLASTEEETLGLVVASDALRSMPTPKAESCDTAPELDPPDTSSQLQSGILKLQDQAEVEDTASEDTALQPFDSPLNSPPPSTGSFTTTTETQASRLSTSTTATSPISSADDTDASAVLGISDNIDSLIRQAPSPYILLKGSERLHPEKQVCHSGLPREQESVARSSSRDLGAWARYVEEALHLEKGVCEAPPHFRSAEHAAFSQVAVASQRCQETEQNTGSKVTQEQTSNSVVDDGDSAKDVVASMEQSAIEKEKNGQSEKKKKPVLNPRSMRIVIGNLRGEGDVSTRVGEAGVQIEKKPGEHARVGMATNDWSAVKVESGRPSGVKRKVVLIGDSSVGKTHLAVKFAKEVDIGLNYPTIFDRYAANIQIDGDSIELDLADTGDLESYASLRKEAYRDADVVLICFSIANPDSLDNIAEAWKEEVQQHCPDIPYLLVGNQREFRDDPKTVAALQQIDQHPVTEEEGWAVGQKIGEVEYIECSAKTGEGVDFVFESATRAALRARKAKKRKSFFRLSKS